MYITIWKAVQAHLSAARMRADIAEFFEYSRWSSFDKIDGLARRIAEKMEAAGMDDVRLIEFPADGKTTYGGWVMPQAYDVQEARLEHLDGRQHTALADYRHNPTSLMMYSMSTPPEGVTADLVIADSPDSMTPERVSGKLVLTKGIGVEFSQVAIQAGAIGVVSDCRNGHAFFKNDPGVDAANEWHNYTIPPWADAGKGFGFSISPEVGRRLRRRLDNGERVRLFGVVKSKHYNGILPVVSGSLKGLMAEEIVLTGHFDEYGADDNCSQIAVALEVCRTLKAMIEAGELAPLQRSIRVLLPMEVRGFNALIQNHDEIRHIIAGLNIDTVGTDQNSATTTCTLSDNLSPSYAEEFAAELLALTAEENPLFRWRRTPAEMIDNIFGEPQIGAPVPQIWHCSADHHLERDKPNRISSRMLSDMARVVGTYAAFLANAGLEEAIWLTELVVANGKLRFEEIALKALRAGKGENEIPTLRRQLENTHDIYAQRIGTARRLVPSVSFVPTAEIIEVERSKFVGPAPLLPREMFHRQAASVQYQLHSRWNEVDFEIRLHARDLAAMEMKAETIAPSRCVPLKTFNGFLSFEDLNINDLAYVRDVLDIPCGWGAPMWLQNALMVANGKRTAGEIASLLYRRHGTVIDVRRLEQTFDFLEKRGMVRMRPYLTQSDVEEALIAAGIAPGDTVLAHFALSWFGYIEGGAECLIDAILGLIGPDGTLVMPTFTFSWFGRMTYDKLEAPSCVGAVTDIFRISPGVVRSEHPTHSFAALGKHAISIVSDHDHTKSPLSEDGPLGKLEALNGKILMFAPPNANTSMHLGEYRAGLPLMDFICPILEDDERREVVVPDCPWHVQFGAAYEKLYARKQVNEVTLGEQSIRVMLCADAIAAQYEVMRDTPELLLQPGCDCVYCRMLIAFCKEQR